MKYKKTDKSRPDPVSDLQYMKPKFKDAIQEAIDFGIDVTLLYEREELSPTERMERHQQMLEFVEELKKAGKKKYGKS